MEMGKFVNLQSDELIMLEEACVPYLWGKANFSPKNWLKSLGLGSHPRLEENQILKVAFEDTCCPGLGTWWFKL